MSLYNIHKRRTLDRLTQKYQLRMKLVIRRHLEAIADHMHRALVDGQYEYNPPTQDVLTRMHGVFVSHMDDVIHVAVSDGIQEITPDNRLSLWEHHSIDLPVELTLTVELAKKRDEIADKLRAKAKKRELKRVEKSARTMLDDYLENIRKVYRGLAHSWINGVSKEEDVVSGLKQVLQKTDYESVRTFRTETTSYFNQTRYDYFSQNTAADYIELYAVTDGRISKICEDRHGFVVPMDRAGLKRYMPAFHPHCRTIQRPLMSRLPSHKTVIDHGLQMNEASFTPLPKGWAA